MRKLKIYTDGKAVTVLKQALVFLSLELMAIPAIVRGSGVTAPPAIRRILQGMFLSGFVLFITLAVMIWLFSPFSPVKWLGIRKELILFTRRFLHSEGDGFLRYFVRWKYGVENGKVTAVLYPRGLEKDTADIGRRLSECLVKPLLAYEEDDGRACYVFGLPPERFNAMEKLMEDITEPVERYTPVLSYEPIPIYGAVVWDFTKETLHILLIAPSGAGKTRFLVYLGSMILKRQHKLYVIDAKRSDFGMIFRYAGVPVATNTEEIIRMLTELVAEMEERYSLLYPPGHSTGEDFREKGMPVYFLIFDEILSVLSFADRKEKEQIVKLLGQIALKGRAAGFSIVIAAQKLNATDLPVSITGQCQTRIILGKLVSDETFRQVTDVSKKEIGTVYRGGKGKGYAVTPKTDKPAYIKTPLLPGRLADYAELLRKLKKRGTNPYGERR